MKFGTLKAGNYVYKITATDAKKSAVVHSNEFAVVKKGAAETNTAVEKTSETAENATAAEKVKAAKPKIKISSVRTPKSVKRKKEFNFSGKIKSDKKLTAVRVQIISSSGKVVQSAKAKPLGKTYNIKKLNKKIKFKKLRKGKYRFKVSAKNASGWKTLVNKKFRIR